MIQKSKDQREIYFIGDIHGCIDEFKQMLDKINYHESGHRIILLGDLINKGPDSKAVLDLVIKEKFECIKGNHEYYFLKKFLPAADEEKEKMVESNKTYQQIKEQLSFYQSVLSSFPLWIEEEDFIAVHAGLISFANLHEKYASLLVSIRTWDQKGHDFKNSRNPPWHNFYQEKKLVIYGHWAKQGLLVKANSIGLDSGCCYGGMLSALKLSDRSITQVKAKKIYMPIKDD